MKSNAHTILVLVAALEACTVGGEAAALKGRKADSSGGTVALGLGTPGDYRQAPLSAIGSVGGTIALLRVGVQSAPAVLSDGNGDGETQADPCDHAADSDTAAAPVANALVWIDDVASGKALPARRREKLTIEHCGFVPPLLAVASGTTINVFSQDAATRTSRFFREASSEAIEEIHTVDAGQVVPSERIASEAGIVEVSDAAHPSQRGYIAVFDHPYFAVTDARGTFTIDSLPPGTYTVKVWRERMPEPREQRVVVTAGGVGRLEVTLTAR